ncbi:helix-turn-helix domain-containing protein [Paenibacillus lactis]|uniref:helix-turn-helix domain-containing protein n=1 Tax=Paenibacillus TaxID=44249 RepID=UPI001642DF2A|nr:helix-turn-helix transcriptional regulator [Paenibacillus sp. IHBB 10380]
MYIPELDYYKGFGYRSDYVHDPNDVMSIYNARKDVLIFIDDLPLHKQIKAKRIIDGLSQESLGKIVRLPASTISLIERGERRIMKNRWKEFEAYLYEMWFRDGVLIDRFTEDYGEEPVEMDIEEQRTYWKAELKDDPDLWGTVL